MKKALLIIGGLGLAGFGLYRYFSYQVDQALKYDYKLKNLKIVSIIGNKVTISVQVDITNNSNFNLTINEYDLQLFFKDIPFATTKSLDVVSINPNSIFSITAQGVIDLDKAKVAVLPFVLDLDAGKPIDIQISGTVKITFIGINSTINLDKQVVNYSVDLLKELNLDDKWQSFKSKIAKLVGNLGIKI